MTIRALIRDITPPIVWRLLQSLRTHLDGTDRVFEGVFSEPPKVDSKGPWETELWIDQQVRSLETYARVEQNFLPAIEHPNDLTVLILNQLSADKEVSVLDFGGSCGETYFHIARSGALLFADRISWCVVDNATSRALGIQYRTDKDKLEFLDSIPEREFDVLHVSTVFQYIDDVENLIESLINTTKPKHVILTRLFGRFDNIEYYSKMYEFGKETKIHIINLKKIINIFEDRKYKCYFRSLNKSEKISPQRNKNIPRHMWVENTAHLFFSKTDG